MFVVTVGRKCLLGDITNRVFQSNRLGTFLISLSFAHGLGLSLMDHVGIHQRQCYFFHNAIPPNLCIFELFHGRSIVYPKQLCEASILHINNISLHFFFINPSDIFNINIMTVFTITICGGVINITFIAKLMVRFNISHIAFFFLLFADAIKSFCKGRLI